MGRIQSKSKVLKMDINNVNEASNLIKVVLENVSIERGTTDKIKWVVRDDFNDDNVDLFFENDNDFIKFAKEVKQNAIL